MYWIYVNDSQPENKRTVLITKTINARASNENSKMDKLKLIRIILELMTNSETKQNVA